VAVFTIKKGTKVRAKATVKDVDGVLATPTTVTIKVMKPDATTTSYTGGQLTNPSTGVYYVDFDADADGDWWAQVATTGTPTVVDEAPLLVLPQKVA
jgi:hypothetical protein